MRKDFRALLAEPASTEEPAAPRRAGPQRRCLVTRATAPKCGLVRFVLAPDGSVLPDVAARLPGRGMWLSARADVIDTPRARAALLRAAKANGAKMGGPEGPVRVPDDLAARTARALAGRIADLIGLARRAGQAVAGHDRAMEWLDAGRAGLLLQASDGSAGGRRKLARRAEGAAVICPLPAAVLGQVFGRDHAVHVAIAPGRLADLIAADCTRLAALSGAADGTDESDDAAGTGGTGTDTE